LLISPFKSVHKSVRLSHSTQTFGSASSQTLTKKHCVSGFYGFSLLMLCCVVASFSGITLAGDALERPKIGLVLAGGGARGAAHIAVLKYLDAHKIPVDIVTGTSMGAIVGGLYASGLSALAIESLMLEMDWEAALIDDVPRQDRSMQRKFREDRFSVGGTPGFGNGELKFPSGAIQGQNVILALQQMTSQGRCNRYRVGRDGSA
jgi:NTE family protein